MELPLVICNILLRKINQKIFIYIRVYIYSRKVQKSSRLYYLGDTSTRSGPRYLLLYLVPGTSTLNAHILLEHPPAIIKN